MKLLALCAVLLSMQTLSTIAGNAQTAKAPDYADPANWVCRPGAESICTTGLDAQAVSADGSKVAQPFKPASDPAIDCFYVYPTASNEQTALADMTDSPEIQRVVNAQAGRLTSRCRLFAPIYRQVTLPQLRRDIVSGEQTKWEVPGEDVAAAFKYYMQHDNHGRGVVLIAHSQGTILLQAIMAKALDGTPAQAQLVSAFLAGDPSLAVPQGADVGGTFKHIPVCRAAAQIGCVYVWGSYLAGDPSPQQTFGKARTDGLVSACSNPAAPSGGSGGLKFYHSRPASAAKTDPAWVEELGELKGSCSSNELGNAFRITVADVPLADVYRGLLEKAQTRGGWGLHTLDLTLVQGNILDVLDAEIAAWKKSH